MFDSVLNTSAVSRLVFSLRQRFSLRKKLPKWNMVLLRLYEYTLKGQKIFFFGGLGEKLFSSATSADTKVLFFCLILNVYFDHSLFCYVVRQIIDSSIFDHASILAKRIKRKERKNRKRKRRRNCVKCKYIF